MPRKFSFSEMGDDEDSANLFGKSCGEVLGFIIMESCD